MTDLEKFEAFKHQIIEENEANYGTEIREKYGDETVNRINAKILGLSKEAYERWTAIGEEILSALTHAARTKITPAGDEGQRIAALHREWLSYSWEKYTPQAHAGLAQMYVMDERFTAYYDKEEPGCAAFLRDAILIYTKQ